MNLGNKMQNMPQDIYGDESFAQALKGAQSNIMEDFAMAVKEAQEVAYQAARIADELCGCQPESPNVCVEKTRGNSVADCIEEASSDLRSANARVNRAISRIRRQFSLQ